jgi:hypothetical protein
VFAREDLLHSLIVFGPVLALLTVGLVITLQSGVGNLTHREDLRKLAGNFSWLLLRVACYAAALFAVQQAIGVRIDGGW